MANKIFSKFFSKKKPIEAKSWSLFQSLNGSFSYSNSSLKFSRYYVESCPVFTATKYISDAAAAIPIIIKDTKTGKFILDHPLINLINNPNPFKDGTLFKKECISFYVLTGNCYINILNSFKNEPLELDSIKPSNVNIETSSQDGYPQNYTITTMGNSTLIYSRNEKKLFYGKNDNQIIQLKDFNPDLSSTNLTGLSTFAGCQLEISQYILASIHNNSLLENQARPSGLISYKGKDALSDEQVNQVKSILNSELSGAANAGKTTFLNGEFNWTQLSQSVKDMDFPALKKSVAENIFNAAKIPLPMVTSGSMTFSNMDSAKYAFYDNAVLPVLKQYLNFMTKHILSKYKGSENLILSYDESEIEALANRKTDNTLKTSQIGILSTNELRTMIGYGALKTGGDDIYQPMNLVPIGTDAYTGYQRDAPAKAKAIFIKTMQDGGYSKEQIKKSVDNYYGNPKSS